MSCAAGSWRATRHILNQSRLFALATLCLCFGVRAETPLPLHDAQWIEANARLEALTRQPFACVKAAASPAEEISVQIGALAFRTPLLLGGQAARAGLSCASCHRNGRGNPHFLFPGLSATPGTADVTSSLMSRKRGDAVFNPKPIPDLARDPPKISRDPARPDLRNFIRGLIVDEFDGPEPSPAVLDGVTAYVAAIDPQACRSNGTTAMTATDEFAAATAGLRSSVYAQRMRDPATARLMLSATRAALGRVHERYQGKRLADARAQIIALDAHIAALQTEYSAKGSDDGRATEAWLADVFSPTVAKLAGLAAHSLYAPPHPPTRARAADEINASPTPNALDTSGHIGYF